MAGRGPRIGKAAVSWGQTQEQHRQSKAGSEKVTIQSLVSSQLGFCAPRRSQARQMAKFSRPLSSCMMQGTGVLRNSDLRVLWASVCRVTLCGSRQRSGD